MMQSERRWARDAVLETLATRAGDALAAYPLILDDLSLGQPISWAVVRDAAGRRALGTALTPVGECATSAEPCADLPSDWRDWPLAALPPRLMADHPLERCLALATVNAIAQHRLAREELAGVEQVAGRGHVVRWVAAQAARRVVVIGNLGPLVAGLSAAGIPHVVFERHPHQRAGAWSDAQEWAWLEQADGLILTGATLLNHTLAPLLALARTARFRVLVGFSAQAHPTFLAGCGLTHVFSVHVRQLERLRRALQIARWQTLFEHETSYFARIPSTE